VAWRPSSIAAIKARFDAEACSNGICADTAIVGGLKTVRHRLLNGESVKIDTALVLRTKLTGPPREASERPGRLLIC